MSVEQVTKQPLQETSNFLLSELPVCPEQLGKPLLTVNFDIKPQRPKRLSLLNKLTVYIYQKSLEGDQNSNIDPPYMSRAIVNESSVYPTELKAVEGMYTNDGSRQTYYNLVYTNIYWPKQYPLSFPLFLIYTSGLLKIANPIHAGFTTQFDSCDVSPQINIIDLKAHAKKIWRAIKQYQNQSRQ